MFLFVFFWLGSQKLFSCFQGVSKHKNPDVIEDVCAGSAFLFLFFEIGNEGTIPGRFDVRCFVFQTFFCICSFTLFLVAFLSCPCSLPGSSLDSNALDQQVNSSYFLLSFCRDSFLFLTVLLPTKIIRLVLKNNISLCLSVVVYRTPAVCLTHAVFVLTEIWIN